MSIGCSDSKCPACSIYRYGNSYPGSGVCHKSTAAPELLDKYAEHCGFIRVTDSWTQWKFGVPFKDLTCGNCQNYKPGEYSHGTCTADKEFYWGRNARFNGAHACNEFEKREGEKLAKSTYWTKCGIEFKKSTNADVTGYELNELDGRLIVQNCIECPFPIEIKDGWGEAATHKRWECRAGSKKPNHKTDWTGSLDDKNTISINSLDTELMDKILQYCKDHPDLSAGYNADHLADCRRTLSISCSANKKGILAKKELIEKFFPEVSEVDEFAADRELLTALIGKEIKSHWDTNTGIVTNISGPHNAYGPGSWSINYTKDGKKSKNPCIINSIKVENGAITEAGMPLQIIESKKVEEVKQECTKPTRACGKCNAGHWYSEDNTYVSVVADDGIKTTKRPCEPHTHYCYQFTEGQKKIAADKDFNPDTAPEWCPMEKDIKYTYEADTQQDEANSGQSEKKKPRIGSETGCNEMKEDCPCFCSHNDGCSVLLLRGSALKSTIKDIYSKQGINCDVYRKVAEKVNDTPETDTQKAEIVNDIAEIDTKTADTVTFDYSTVDADTAEFLQEKASKITEIRLKSVLAIGKELKAAQDKLANKKNGTFGAWSGSIGISRQTAYNYINGYDFIVKNFDNIEAAEDLSPSLLFAAAKKDAPQELQQGVVSGDITSLKEYKALEDKLKVAEAQLEMATKARFDAVNSEIKAKQDAKKAQKDRDASIDTFKRDINNLNQQLDQAKRNSDPTKVRKLGAIISEKQQEIEALKKQLSDKPIEVPAVKEVIPDEVRLAIYEKVVRLYEGLCKLTETEIQIFAEDVSEDYRTDVIAGTEDASEVLARIAHAIYVLTE